MARYIMKRILMLIPVLLGVMLVIFIFQEISPDDPVRSLLGEDAPPAQVEALRKQLGLDQPILIQFVRYVWNFVRYGDLGTSYVTGQPVLRELMQRWPVTIKLAFMSVGIGVLMGLPLGILSAVKQNTWIDSAILGFTVFITSFPNFWFALLLIVLFAVKLGWLPSMGIMAWQGWIMPVAVMSIGMMAMLARNTRASVLEGIRQDYVRTARAKGQRERKIICGHVLRNSMIPITNVIGNGLAGQLGGAVIIETVFGLPGIGLYAVNAVGQRNYPSVLGSVVLLAFVFAGVNLLIDICYVIIDPKLRYTFTDSARANTPKRLAKRHVGT